jgi:hypothetical protein
MHSSAQHPLSTAQHRSALPPSAAQCCSVPLSAAQCCSVPLSPAQRRPGEWAESRQAIVWGGQMCRNSSHHQRGSVQAPEDICPRCCCGSYLCTLLGLVCLFFRLPLLHVVPLKLAAVSSTKTHRARDRNSEDHHHSLSLFRTRFRP